MKPNVNENPREAASQAAAILAALQSGRKLTALDAQRDKEIRSLRLGARIWDLRQQGIPVQSERIKLRNGKRVSRYFLN